jgi:hypothetical protein
MKRRRARLGLGLSTAVAVLALALPGSATGAVTIGETFTPTSSCIGDYTILQTASPGDRYAAPSDGVITSWSYQTAANPLTLVFKVARRQTGTDFTVIGESELETAAANRLNTYLSRLPVERGDVIGLFRASDGLCNGFAPSYSYSALPGEVALGSTDTFNPALPYRFPVSARLEPDCDNDGFGDETQDQATESCDPPPIDTVAPRTFITKDAPKKLRKSKVKFKFVSDDPTASFECRLKGKGLDRLLKQFSECSSPRKYKRLDEGKYKFQVRATDPAGNVGAPAKDKFKVV